MIHVNKGAEPEYLQSDEIELAWEKLEEFYQSKDRSQKRYRYPYKEKIDNQLKPILHGRFHGKCGYCESEIENPKEGIIDRFRPHNGVRDKKEYYQDLYWWLTYEWDNLIYSCKECSEYKGNYFPVKGTRILSNDGNIESEIRLLLHPCKDKPQDHFIYDDYGNIHAITELGQQTIELLRLDRSSLVEKRKIERETIIEIVEKIIQEGPQSVKAPQINYIQNIYNYDNWSIQFLSFKKWIIANELDTNPSLGQQLQLEDFEQDLEKPPRPEVSTREWFLKEDVLVSDFFPLEYIFIKNFKGISELHLDFKQNGLERKSWMFLLGENGVGKSSILQAIAIGLNPKFLDKKKGLIPSLIKKGKQTAEIQIKERDSENIVETILIRKDQSFAHSGEFRSFLLGYGSLRLSTDDTNRSAKKDTEEVSYDNLFVPTTPLNDVTKWLKSIHQKSPSLFNSVAYSIKQLLPHDFTDNELVINKGEIEFKNSQQTFSELSDGFKSTIILAVDIMMKLSGANTDMDKLTGIVLIDELGNQLHPRWQMRIVNQLREVFPQINFIISTHHPLCLRGSESEEVVLLKNVNKEVEVITELPDPSGLRVDQLLSSEFFGLSSLLDPEIEAKFNRYYELLSLNQVTPNQSEELNNLKDELRNKKQLGSTLREEIMYSVIDRLLAQNIVFSKKLLKRDELKEEAIRRVSKIWKDLNIDQND